MPVIAASVSTAAASPRRARRRSVIGPSRPQTTVGINPAPSKP
ncbi:MAG: hypothetical protein U0575_10155 [Phycisphaerales bacterium]